MRMIEALEMRDRIDERAAQLQVPPPMLMRDFLMDRLLERLAASPWRDKIVLKGSVLVGTLLATRRRAGKGPDVPVRGFNLTTEDAESIFASIAAIDTGDGASFALDSVQEVGDAAEYPGVRVAFKATFGPTTVPFFVDVTAEDTVTPALLVSGHPLLFDERYLPLSTYPPISYLAECLEAVISMGTADIRMRDYYDIYALWKVRGDELPPAQVRRSLRATADACGTYELMGSYREEMGAVAESPRMQKHWESYREQREFARDLTLQDMCDTVCEIMDQLEW